MRNAIVLFIVMLMCMVSETVFAAGYGFEAVNVTVDKDNEILTISGRVLSHRKGVGVTLQMMTPTSFTLNDPESELDKVFEDKLNSFIAGTADFDSVFEQCSEYATSAGGYFNIRFKITGNSGTYKIRMANSEGDDVFGKYIEFYSAAYVQGIVNDINHADTPQKVRQILEREIINQDMDKGLYKRILNKSIDVSGVYSAVYNADAFNTFGDLSNFVVKQLASVALCSNDGELFDKAVSDYAEILGIGPLKTFTAFKGYTEPEKGEIRLRLSQTGAGQNPEYTFATTVFMFGLHKLTLWTQLNPYVNGQYDSVLALDVEGYNDLTSTENIDKALINGTYDKYTDFAEDFNNLVETAANTHPSTQGGSRGGGKSSGGGTTAVFDAGMVNNIGKSTVAFEDLDSVEWAKEAIYALAESGVLKGTGNNTFEPDLNVTREQFITMIVNLYGYTSKTGSADFMDVRSGEWYYGYVAAAVEQGIIQGIDSGVFGIGDSITRQDMAVIAYRALKAVKGDIPYAQLDFKDSGSIADYAKEAVAAMRGLGIINGYEDGSFAPEEYTTRAQAAKIIYGLLRAKS